MTLDNVMVSPDFLTHQPTPQNLLAGQDQKREEIVIKVISGYEEDLSIIFDLRQSFFGMPYPKDEIKNEYDLTALHFIAFSNQLPILCLTWHLGNLPSSKYVDLEPLVAKGKNICEFKSFCCKQHVPESTLQKAAKLLLSTLLDHLSNISPGHLIISVSSRNEKNISRYYKLGFKKFDSFVHPHLGVMQMLQYELKNDIPKISSEAARVRFRKGLSAVMVEVALNYLKEISAIVDASLREIFIKLKQYLTFIKKECDKLDLPIFVEDRSIKFIKERGQKIFSILDIFFKKIYELTKTNTEVHYEKNKQYFHNELASFFYLGEVNRRSYEKPLGYPGDFKLINYLYEDEYAGGSTFSKLMHQYTLSFPISKAVKARLPYLHNKIMAVLGDRHLNRSNILSVGSGSAMEVVQLHQARKLKNCTFNFVDSEKLALAYARERLRTPLQNDVQFRYFNVSILNLLKNEELRRDIGLQDLIYSVGLFDYLSDNLSVALCKQLYDMLKKRGQLIIGNMSPMIGYRKTFMEFVGEWFLVYRSREDLMKIGNAVLQHSPLRFEQFNNEVQWYLILQKEG